MSGLAGDGIIGSGAASFRDVIKAPVEATGIKSCTALPKPHTGFNINAIKQDKRNRPKNWKEYS